MRELRQIEKLQSKEYQRLFPPTSEKVQNKEERLEAILKEQLRPNTPQEGECQGQAYERGQEAHAGQKGWTVPQDGSKVDPTQLSARRGPPTDRPPDKPPPWKGGSRGACWRGQAPDTLASWLPSHADHIARVAMPSLCRKCKLRGARHRTIPRHVQLVPLKIQVPVRVELDACEVWSVQG
jgi:hypothetical protein